MAQIPATTSGVTTKAVRSARVAELWEASAPDEARFILRRQLPFKAIAESSDNIGTLRWRYHEPGDRPAAREPSSRRMRDRPS